VKGQAAYFFLRRATLHFLDKKLYVDVGIFYIEVEKSPCGGV